MSEPGLAPVLLTLDEVVPAQPSLLQSMVLMVVIVGIMYVVLYLPQQRERKKHEELVSGLKRDDRVITNSGIHGRVVTVADTTVVVEIADRTKVTFDKHAVSTVVVPEGSETADTTKTKKKG